MPLVLCTGVDPVLLKTRQLILESAGHTVLPASDEREIKIICSKQKFDVAVIGQSIPPRIKARAMELVKEHCPEAKILELCAPYGTRTLENADAWLEMPSDQPELLVALVNRLADKKTDAV